MNIAANTTAALLDAAVLNLMNKDINFDRSEVARIVNIDEITDNLHPEIEVTYLDATGNHHRWIGKASYEDLLGLRHRPIEFSEIEKTPGLIGEFVTNSGMRVRIGNKKGTLVTCWLLSDAREGKKSSDWTPWTELSAANTAAMADAMGTIPDYWSCGL